mgnify:CR=1 FL=1
MVLTHLSGLGGIEMSDRPIYTFVGATIPDIDPAHDVVHNHHITIKFRPSAADHDATPYGDSCWWVATGRVITDDVDAVIVSFVGGNIRDSDIASGVPHITISVRDGVSPAASADAIRHAIDTDTVIPFRGFGHGTVSGFTGKN